jgi:hypothetical protein
MRNDDDLIAGVTKRRLRADYDALRNIHRMTDLIRGVVPVKKQKVFV